MCCTRVQWLQCTSLVGILDGPCGILVPLIRDQTQVPCIRRRILNHWTTREVLGWVFLTLPLQMGKNPESIILPGAHPSRSILLGSPPCFLPQLEVTGREGCQAGLSLPAAPPCGPPRLRAFPEGRSSCQEATHGASVSPGVVSRPSPRSAHILVIALFQALSKPPELSVPSVSCWTLTNTAAKLPGWGHRSPDK